MILANFILSSTTVRERNILSRQWSMVCDQNHSFITFIRLSLCAYIILYSNTIDVNSTVCYHYNTSLDLNIYSNLQVVHIFMKNITSSFQWQILMDHNLNNSAYHILAIADRIFQKYRIFLSS